MAEIRKFLSLLILLVILLVLAAIGYVVYMIVTDISLQTKKKMEKKNINLSRDGMKVSVKHVSAEQVSDSTQGVLTQLWNAASFPNYHSRLGWNQEAPASPSPAGTPGAGTEKRKPFSRSASSQQKVKQ